jgi:hypothetical protein
MAAVIRKSRAFLAGLDGSTQRIENGNHWIESSVTEPSSDARSGCDCPDRSARQLFNRPSQGVQSGAVHKCDGTKTHDRSTRAAGDEVINGGLKYRKARYVDLSPAPHNGMTLEPHHVNLEYVGHRIAVAEVSALPRELTEAPHSPLA